MDLEQPSGDAPERVHVHHMRPDEILARRAETPVVFLPVGPLEWHGPHLPFGVDPLRAELAAAELALRLGGVVCPTLYAGTERERSPEMLRNIGFGGDEYVVGMDFPSVALPSLYFREEVFALVLRHWLDLLIGNWGFRTIVIVNGHGGENHLAVIRRLCTEYGGEGRARVLLVAPVENYPDSGSGHATLEETETLMAHFPDDVDLGRLPPRPEPLENLDWAVVDDASFRGRSATHRVCEEEDPRLADPESGRARFARTLDQLEALLRSQLSSR